MEILNAHVEAIRAYLNEEAMQVQEAGAKAFSSGDSAEAMLLIEKLKKLESLRSAVDYVEKTVEAIDSEREVSARFDEGEALAEIASGVGTTEAVSEVQVPEIVVSQPVTEMPSEAPVKAEEPVSKTQAELDVKKTLETSNGNGHLPKSPEKSVLDEIVPPQPLQPAIAISDEERKVLLEMLHDGKIAVTQTTNRLVDATDQGHFSESMYKSTICRARGMIELGIKLGTSVSSIREDVELLKQRFNTNAKNHSFYGLNLRRELPYDQWLEFSDAYEWMACVPKALHMIDEGSIESEIDRSQVMLQCAATTTLVRALLSELTDSVKDHEQFRLEGVLRERADMPFVRWWRAISLTDEIMDLQDHAALLPETLERILNRRLDMVDLSLRYR